MVLQSGDRQISLEEFRAMANMRIKWEDKDSTVQYKMDKYKTPNVQCSCENVAVWKINIIYCWQYYNGEQVRIQMMICTIC